MLPLKFICFFIYSCYFNTYTTHYCKILLVLLQYGKYSISVLNKFINKSSKNNGFVIPHIFSLWTNSTQLKIFAQNSFNRVAEQQLNPHPLTLNIYFYSAIIIYFKYQNLTHGEKLEKSLQCGYLPHFEGMTRRYERKLDKKVGQETTLKFLRTHLNNAILF